MYEKYTGTQIQRKRLKRFINFIRGINKKIFRLDVTCLLSSNNTDKNMLDTFKDKIINGKDGAYACACGLLPLFNPREFKWIESYEDIIVVDSKSRINPWAFIRDYFGIDSGLHYLFVSMYYKTNGKRVTPKMLADKLQKLLDGSLKG